MLFEELDTVKKMVTGFTDNYTRVYVKYDDEAAATDLINEFADVKLGQPFEEGMTAELI